MQSELNQIYDDLLYWRTPVQYIGDYIDIFSPTKSLINNAKGNLERESIDAAKTVSTENNKDTTVEDCKLVPQAQGKYNTNINTQDNDTGIDLSPQDLTDPLSDQYQSAKERDFSTPEEKKDIKPHESQSQIKRDEVQIDGGNENQFLNASCTSEKDLDHATEEVDSGLKEDTSSIPVFEAVDVNYNYNNNNNNNNNNSAESDAYSDLDSTPTSQSDDSLDEGSNVKFSGSRLFAFTYTSSNLFTSAVQRKRRLVRLGVMGNSNTHHHVKQSSKKEKVSRRRSQKSTTTSQPEKLSTPSSGLKTRKRQHNDNSSVGSRLSGQYDNISVLSSHDVLSTASRKEKDLGSVEKAKSPRLTGSSLSTSDDSTSANKSLQDLLAYKPSLKTEFDFRKMEVPEPTEKQAVEDQEITSRGQDLRDGEEATENVSDSTLLTLKGVCCAISSLQEKLLTDSNDKSPDRLLLANKYTGRRHPSISPSYPILSTRTPMSPAQSPFNSPGSRSPAEPNSPAEIQRASLQRKINQERTISTNVTSTQPCSTVNELNCDATMTSSDKNTITVSALKDILSSNEGFSGSLLNSWLLGNSSDEETEKFIEEFCDLLLRSGLLVVMPKEELKPHEKGTTTTDSKNLFNRLKFVPSQIYTWGPFSRIASNSPHKTSTYRDYRVRQVEVSPTVASTTKSGKKDGRYANGGEDATAATPKSSPEKLSQSKSVSPRTVESCDSSFSAASTSFSSSLPSHSGSGDSVSDNKTQTLILESNPTSPTSTNSSKKLGNVWPPPRPEEDDAHKQKYTEAEHQHEMMVMKRNHTEELYKITKDYETNIYEMNEEHTQDIESMQQEANLMRQEIAYLKAKLNADKQDASTQTQNVAQLRMSKGIQVDFAGDLFSPPPQITLPTIDENATVPSAPPPPPIPGAIPPPPPPPPPMGGVPPPPPMGGPPPPTAPGFPSSKGDSPRRAPIEPKKPMKPLYWKRIQIPKKELKNNKSVWIHIEDVPINVDEMEQMFSKTTTTKKAKALSETITEKKKIAPAKIFDSKRSQAVGIFLSSLHTEMKDIRDAILNLDTSIVDEENMKSIFDLKATKEELDSIQAHLKSQDKKKEEERQPLDKPEQFLHDLAKIECFEDRLFCITFRTAFSEDIQSLQKELSHINNALQELQDKHTVLRVLGLILSMGNYLNGGNRTRGQADGFQLEILSKLKDMKGLRPDNTTFTLLNYIAWAYMRRYDLDVSYEVRSCPVPTFQSIILASQVNFNDIAKDLKRVRKELKECSKKVSEVIKSSVERIQPFKDIMEQFVEQAYATVEELDNDLKSTQESFKDAVDFFCVKSKSGSSKSIEPKEFFTHWQTFCMDFHATWKVEMKRLVKEEQQKLKKNIEESREKQATTTVVTTVRRRPNSLRTRLNQPRRRRKDGGSSTGNTT